MRIITIEYHRLPNRVSYIPSMLLYEDENRMIVLNMLNRATPLLINGHCLVEKGCIGVWLIDLREWYDLGAIYDSNRNLRGYYCDVTTPAEKTKDGYRVIDLMLDFCMLPDQTAICLDLDEFEEGVHNCIINNEYVESARKSLVNLQEKAAKGTLITPEIERLTTLPPNIEEIREKILEARMRRANL